MPMIDVYATSGTFANPKALARDLASTLMKIVNRDKQLAVVRQFTDLVASAAGDPSLTARTWVLLTEAIEGGWGLAGQANTNGELVDAARAQIAELQKAKGAGG